MDNFGRLFNTWLGLVGLGAVLFFVFRNPRHTSDILTTAGNDTGDFIASLQGR
jgi:hypothetical protein